MTWKLCKAGAVSPGVATALVSLGCLVPAIPAQEPPPFTAPKTETKDIAVAGPTKRVIPRSVPLLNMKFDNIFFSDPSKPRSITYTLPQPAYVRFRVLRAGTRELYLASIVDFEFREAGTHTEVWDGRDYWGNPVDYSKTPYLILHWTETDAMSAAADPKGVEYKEGESQRQVAATTNFPGRHLHATHPSEYENVPLLKITNITPDQVLRGKVTVKAAVAKARRGMGDKYGYGVRYYVDDQIIHEEFYKPESRGEFSYEVDTTAFPNGKHLLYIGVCDHNEHTTSYGVDVVIKN